MQLFNESGVKMLTRGLTAHLGRNFLMATALSPIYVGTNNQLTSALFGLTAILASHPFEVARVHIVNGETSHLTGRVHATIGTLYKTEGIAGLYKGLIPRTLHLMPAVMTVQWLLNAQR